ncbi:hypothetical protein TIFTF001_048298 [Ficus carica]|uniref:Uncharacterized protein n=1 Tax=Ficus carica TaxID=3494 RepID=A0AA87ZFU8_FICCA|nr:hypothetical protein TIFTF001_048291 [Ficus carica]GMN33798.1 hypothetical protein TIFTF001_048294 [Ficus carica]GMN33816.1 hypothetical protein TIFTF001_048295 [Ficus carica]GMN33832.1 hypothetical protein TIFTF001_048298 [Ficus carica]
MRRWTPGLPKRSKTEVVLPLTFTVSRAWSPGIPPVAAGGSAAAERVAWEWWLLDRTLLGSARSYCCRLGLSRRVRSLPRPPVGEGLRGRLPNLGGLLGVDSATSSESRSERAYVMPGHLFHAGSSESPASLWEPGRRHGNPDNPALPWPVVGLFESVRGKRFVLLERRGALLLAPKC